MGGPLVVMKKSGLANGTEDLEEVLLMLILKLTLLQMMLRIRKIFRLFHR